MRVDCRVPCFSARNRNITDIIERRLHRATLVLAARLSLPLSLSVLRAVRAERAQGTCSTIGAIANQVRAAVLSVHTLFAVIRKYFYSVATTKAHARPTRRRWRACAVCTIRTEQYCYRRIKNTFACKSTPKFRAYYPTVWRQSRKIDR